eukprot:671272-Rhodomonas_salina.2
MAMRNQSGGGDDGVGWGVCDHAGPSHSCVAHSCAAPWSRCSPLQVLPSRALAQHATGHVTPACNNILVSYRSDSHPVYATMDVLA